MDGQMRGSERFTYDKSWEEIEAKLDEAERLQNAHYTALQKGRLTKRQRLHHMKQYKGLEGAIATLRWTLGDPQFDPLPGRKD